MIDGVSLPTFKLENKKIHTDFPLRSWAQIQINMTYFLGDYTSIKAINIKPFLFQHDFLFSRVPKEVDFLEANWHFVIL